jgi:hypothetical protein
MKNIDRDVTLTDPDWLAENLNFELNRVRAALRNDPSEREKFVLTSRLEDYANRINNSVKFEVAREKFFADNVKGLN